MKPAKASQAYGCFFICNLTSIQWLIFAYESPFYAPCFYLHSYSFLFFYSRLCWCLIWWVPALFNHLNAYNSVKLSCKCPQLIYSWAVFLVPTSLTQDLVWLMATTLPLDYCLLERIWDVIYECEIFLLMPSKKSYMLKTLEDYMFLQKSVFWHNISLSL